MPRHFLNFRRSAITKINFRMASLGNIKSAAPVRSFSEGGSWVMGIEMLKMDTIIKTIKKLLPKAVIKKLPKEIIVKEVSKGESREINRKYRHKNKPANVLSFCYGKDYGEILVCPEVIRKEAKEQDNSYKYQMTWMILHGMLHLGGMHHEFSAKARNRFEKIEKVILARIFK